VIRFARNVVAGLGLLAGAVSLAPGPLAAQQPTPQPAPRPTPQPPRPTPLPVNPDTIRPAPAPRDTVAGRDTTIVVPIPPQPDTIVKRDSVLPTPPKPAAPTAEVQPPLARAFMPRLVEGARQELRWTRDSLFMTGAFTLTDLLERVPGFTALRGGYLQAPAVGAYLGETARIRVFYDGLELDALNPRNGAPLDLATIPIWSAEELRIERGAGEIRVYIRSWRADRVTPYTRVDIGTGDQETNLYRAFFGKRWKHGEALQFGAQQYSTTPSRLGASSNSFNFFTRLGWARKGWSGDLFAMRGSPHRGIMFAAERVDSIPSLSANRTDAYARLAYGDPESGRWFQLIAGAEGFRFGGRGRDSTAADTLPMPSADTTRYVGQYVATGGFTALGIQLEGAARYRTFMGESRFTPSGRATYDSPLLGASLLAEGRGLDSASRVDAQLRVTPLGFLTFGAAYGRHSQLLDAGDLASTSLRVEGAVRFRGLWLGGGLLQRDTAFLEAPRVFSQRFVGTFGGRAKGAFASVRGQLWGPLRVDLLGIRWDDSSGFYRPRWQTRSELTLASNFLQRFPSGNFGLMTSLVHEHRSLVNFPVAGEDANPPVALRSPGFRQVSFLLEIRLVQAVLTYQFRNLLGEEYAPVPVYPMPRQTQFYGVRWEFWN
jgi:hypothetical protein